ncbi:LacI family DNA-binding transcriptional regulator [Frigoribacterium faeni]|uniref:LacI family transcriptional regulator n=2 Tax=Frigoribacterium faeni TaxID=145483 RepID=A0A7W3JIW9_9MICO|nr:LacI family DNA-binding transcriptional regulator [Frigoribacterium faeni]MBA8813683.1 LacI family transcriptional regulator [Frigoribacterium faeni]
MTTSTPSSHRRPPVMADVARLAGVSLGTVSNVVNAPDRVKPATRRKVEDAIASLGFTPNTSARTLAAGRGTLVGFVAVDLGNSYFLDIARGVEREADLGQQSVLLGNSDVDLDKQTGYLKLFEQAQAAGIVLAPFDGPMDEARRLRQRGLRVVNVNWPGEPDESCGVVVDEVRGGRLAAQHLLDQGRRELVFVGGPLDLTAVRHRFEGASAAAREAGVPLQLVTTAALTVRAGLAVGSDLLAQDAAARPDGIVAASDALASGIVQSLLLGGVRIPDDVSITGYDDNHFAQGTTLPLTTVGQPGVEMGGQAMRLLRDELDNPATHRHETVVLPPRLIVRGSSLQRPGEGS